MPNQRADSETQPRDLPQTAPMAGTKHGLTARAILTHTRPFRSSSRLAAPMRLLSRELTHRHLRTSTDVERRLALQSTANCIRDCLGIHIEAEARILARRMSDNGINESSVVGRNALWRSFASRIDSASH